MAARVFISCGQRDGEREIAKKVADWFSDNGYQSYVALEVQSVQDINAGIIGELRRSDFYVFIDFRREEILFPNRTKKIRGSLFSHQELAIAYAFRFENCLFFRENDVELEGMCAFMTSNAISFDNREMVCELVAEAVRKRKWSPKYSRNLLVDPPYWHDTPISYGDLTGRFLYIKIRNLRTDVGALGVVARLESMQLDGKELESSPNQSPLKVTGQAMAFAQTIWPQSHGTFDLLCVDIKHGAHVYLNNALDVSPRPLLIEKGGEHLLNYEVFAYGFERLQFSIRLRITGNCNDATAELVSSTLGPKL